MITALGHCEDPACAKSSSGQELVRLFRCSIHCDRLLCLFHLNAHDVYYEEEKKQNDVVLTELQNSLTLYQSIFEQQIQTYRELVHQASSILLHNTSSIVPIEQIRPVLEKIQKAIAFLQHEKVIIKNESTLDITEPESEKLDMNLLRDLPAIKKEPNETAPKVVVRIDRVDTQKDTPVEVRLPSEQTNRNPPAPLVDRPQTFRLKESVQVVSSRSAKEPVPSPRRTRAASPAKKKCERVKKKPDKTVAVKRLQT